MFKVCKSLTSLDVSRFNTAKVTDMGEMFYGCYSLTSLDVSNFNTAKVMDMQSMFYGCSALTSLNLSGFDTKNVGSMDPWYKVGSMNSMFRACESLTSLNLSSFDMSGETNTNSMFAGCSKLATVNLGERWKWVGSNGYLPAPSSDYITGADGKWYNSETGQTYDPSEIPSNTAATYVAVMPNDAPGNTPDALSASKALRDTTAASTQMLDGGAQAAVAPTNETTASTNDAPGAAADDASAVDASGRQATSNKGDGDSMPN